MNKGLVGAIVLGIVGVLAAGEGCASKNQAASCGQKGTRVPCQCEQYDSRGTKECQPDGTWSTCDNCAAAMTPTPASSAPQNYQPPPNSTPPPPPEHGSDAGVSAAPGPDGTGVLEGQCIINGITEEGELCDSSPGCDSECFPTGASSGCGQGERELHVWRDWVAEWPVTNAGAYSTYVGSCSSDEGNLDGQFAVFVHGGGVLTVKVSSSSFAPTLYAAASCSPSSSDPAPDELACAPGNDGQETILKIPSLTDGEKILLTVDGASEPSSNYMITVSLD